MSDLFLKIKFWLNEDRFDVESNVKSARIKSIVENIVRSHIGAGVDNSKAVERDVYTINIGYNMDDSYTLGSDTGNKGLTTGILSKFLADYKDEE